MLPAVFSDTSDRLFRGWAPEQLLQAVSLLFQAHQPQAQVHHRVADRIVERFILELYEEHPPVLADAEPELAQAGGERLCRPIDLYRQELSSVSQGRDGRRAHQPPGLDLHQVIADALDF